MNTESIYRSLRVFIPSLAQRLKVLSCNDGGQAGFAASGAVTESTYKEKMAYKLIPFLILVATTTLFVYLEIEEDKNKDKPTSQIRDCLYVNKRNVSM